jgi:hypothetical protein
MSGEVHPNHKRQIDEGVATSLKRAGVPANMVHRSARELANGEELAGRLTGDFKDHIAAGGLLTVTGSGRAARNCVILSARALHIQGVGCKILSLSALAQLLANPNTSEEDLARLFQMKCLVIQRFYYPDGEGDQIMTYRTRSLVEDFLLDRMDEGRGHLVHASTIPPVEDPAKWWSRDFIKTFFSEYKHWEAGQ